MDSWTVNFYINRNADSSTEPNFSAIQSLPVFATFTICCLNTGFLFQPRAEGNHEFVGFLGLRHISTVTAGRKTGTGEWCDKAAACQVIRYEGGRSHRHA